MPNPSAKDRISKAAMDRLAEHPEGLRFSDLVARLRAAFPDDPYGTITGNVWNLDSRKPEGVYKPSRGLFRLTKFREPERPSDPEPFDGTRDGDRVRESDFYQSFADYLVQDLEECTKAVPLGGSRFGPKWGTPDVIGVFKSRESDIVKSPLEVVVAEIKLDERQLITAFGQACAYRLFSHRSYLVVPRSSPPEDMDRLEGLCLTSGIGLILFDAGSPRSPGFQIRVRAARHEPDMFYLNQNLRIVASDLDL